MTFATALEALYVGDKIARSCWNGKSQYIQLGRCITFQTPEGHTISPSHNEISNNVIVFYSSSGHQVGWLASQADMLASDWIIIE